MPGVALEKSLREKERRGNKKRSEGGPASMQVSPEEGQREVRRCESVPGHGAVRGRPGRATGCA